MPTVHERVATARDRLRAAGLSPAEAEIGARVLAERTLGWTTARLLTDGRDPEPVGFQRTFDALVARRAAREPLAYIVGEREFWGLALEVTPDVLIPRSETELIVEEAIQLFRLRPPSTIFDVCTGSGCLAVALATEFPLAEVVATDISGAALT